MSTGKLKSALISAKSNWKKSILKINKYKDKTVVFFGDLTYEAKGRLFNLYDRARFFISDLRSNEEHVDIIEYKGVSKPGLRARIKKYSVSRIDAFKSKMPDSIPEVNTAVKHTFKTVKRGAKKGLVNIKDICSDGLSSVWEYVSGVRISTVAGLSAIAVGGFALMFMLTTVVGSYAMGVTINGERVGFVESEEQLTALVEDVQKELSEENHNTDIKIDEEAIEVDSMAKSVDEVTILDESALKETIMNNDAVSANASAIVINGEPVLYVGTAEDAEAVLASIQNKYNVAGQDVFVDFKQDVKVTDAEVKVSDLMPTANAITYLLTGNETIEKYKVKKNDTDWDIAVANGLTEKDIQKANPDMDTKVIKKGDVINISKMEPFVHLETVATVDVTQKINYKTKKVKSDELYVGETKVKKEGVRGEKSVTKRAVYVNGKEVSAQIIEEKVVKKSVRRVVLVGTKEKPVETNYNNNSAGNSDSSTYKSGGDSYVSGNGTLSNPMRNMELSSPFGYRNGRQHAGLDLRNPAGTAIYAAASGKVTYSGYDGAYGNTVRVSHGNGMVTVYAHCQSLYVKSGASVSKGQQIATVGRTGRATGNHLHFEVRINGVAKNPYSYL